MLTPGRKTVNAPVRIAANFQDEERIDIDPDTVKLRILSPSGVETTYVYGTDDALVKASTGDYYVDFKPAQSGRWSFRWETTGTNKETAPEGEFVVQRSPFYDGVQDAYR